MANLLIKVLATPSTAPPPDTPQGLPPEDSECEINVYAAIAQIFRPGYVTFETAQGIRVWYPGVAPAGAYVMVTGARCINGVVELTYGPSYRPPAIGYGSSSTGGVG